MKKQLLFVIMSFWVFIIGTASLYAQNDKENKEFNLALRDLIAKKIAAHGDYLVEQEKFLLTLISLTNNDMRERIGDVVKARKNFLQSLDKDREKIRAIKERLHARGKHDLDMFIEELENKITKAIESKEIDFKRKRVFEDGIQLLQMAEEMSAGDNSAFSNTGSSRYAETKRKLESQLQKKDSNKTTVIRKEVNLYDLYKEWILLKLTDFQTKYMKVKYYRKKLINKSNLSQIRKMAANEIEVAYQAFNYNDYDLAVSLLEDAYKTYSEFLNDFSDVLYYAGEAAVGAGQYPRALKWYRACIDKYPNTEYYMLSLVRLIQLDILFEKYDNAFNLFSEYLNLTTSNDPNLESLILTVALTYFNQDRYDEAVKLLSEIKEESENYFLAQYLLSKSYAATNNFVKAKEILSNLIRNKNVSPELFQRALLRYALILYEEKDYSRAINILLKIDESFSHFDLVINALAWAEYKYQKTLPEEEQDYYTALQFIDMLVNEYYGSPYTIEAKTLKAYILQITNNPTAAKDQYREVYLAKKYKSLNDDYLAERAKLKDLIEKARQYESKALMKNNYDVYKKIKNTRYKIEDNYNFYRLSELNAHGTRFYSEISKMLQQIKEIERLRIVARNKNDEVLVKRLDMLELKIRAMLDRISLPKNIAEKPYNFFELNPTAKQVSEAEYRNRKILEARRNIQYDIKRVNEQIGYINNQIKKASLVKDGSFPALVRKKAMFLELKEKYEKLLSYAYSVKVKPAYGNLNKWADYGAFGMINVNFEMRQNTEGAIKYNANIVSQIEQVFKNKKKAIESQIKLIEAEIKKMTMRAREEERNRVRAERERSFKEGYFDTRSSEFEPILPEIQLEGQSTKDQGEFKDTENNNNDQ